MKPELQAELIGKAAREVGLDGHCKWIENQNDAVTWAEKIARRFKSNRQLVVKNSYMYSETLDMCFFYTHNDKAAFTYAGYATIVATDIDKDNLPKAFELAKKLLMAMDRLVKECEEQ